MASPEWLVSLGPQGRLVIPAKLRRELGLEEGTTLAVRTEDGRLILEPRDEILRRWRRKFAHLPKDRLLSEELSADRREEARRELEE